MTDRGIDPGKVPFAGKDRFRNAFAGKWIVRSADNGPYQVYQVVCPNQHCRSISQAFLISTLEVVPYCPSTGPGSFVRGGKFIG